MRISRVSPLILALAILPSAAPAQCLEWSSEFGAAGTASATHALASGDLGGGPELFAGGDFDVAGSQLVWRLGRWTGSYWTGVQGGLSERCTAALLGDDGTGPALFLGGDFRVAGGINARSVAKWDGTTWSGFAPGFNGSVRALALFDDGTGTKLYAGGTFGYVVSGPAVNGIARWNGASWEPMGNGLGSVFALAVHDDGTGRKLYAGGAMSVNTPSGIVRGLARWNGTSWEPVGTDTSGHGNVYALSSSNVSGTSELWIGGSFPTAGGITAANVARWNGSTFLPAGAGLASSVHALVEHDDGSGPSIVAGGEFTASGATPMSRIARFDGAQWVALGAGVNARVDALTVHAQGGAEVLVAGGEFTRAGSVGASHVAGWDGSQWSAFGVGHGVENRIVALDVVDEVGGRALYAGGDFTTAGGTDVDRVARWNGTGWSRLPGTFAHATSSFGPQVRAIASYDDGTGLDLYVAGFFTSIDGVPMQNIARWDGSAWSSLGTGVGVSYGIVSELHVFDDGNGPLLYVGGFFDTAGGTTAPNVARWDGQQWTSTNAAPEPSEFVVFDDGAGPKLYSAGIWSISRLDGTTWTSLVNGGGTTLGASALAVFDDGTGPALYAAGGFSLGGSNVVRWTGSGWVGLAGGVGGTSYWETQSFGAFAAELAVFDDGSGGGPALHVAGRFALAGGNPARSIARWDGAQWSALGEGIAPQAISLAVHDDGASGGAALFVAGELSVAGPFGVSNIARWQRSTASGCEARTGTAFCFGDGTGTACPCGNFGSLGRGCASAVNANGARLEAFGRAHVAYDDVVLTATGLPAVTTALVFQGSSRVFAGLGTAFGDGLRCAGGSVIRLVIRSASSGVVEFGAGIGTDPAVSLAGAIPPAGATRVYQAWYRDAQSFCTSATYNLTNAVELIWAH